MFEYDVVLEENDGFGLYDGDIKLKCFIEKFNVVKGIDVLFKEVFEGYVSVLLGNLDMFEMISIFVYVF